MFKISNKAIAAISGVSAAIIATSTVLTSLAIKQENGQSNHKEKPLNRGKDYYHYNISSKIASDTRINNLIDKIEQDNTIVYVINEQKFLDNIKSLAQTAIKSIPTFTKNYLNYSFICNYKIKNTKSIMVDLVWSEPNKKLHYYDQFILSLESI